MSDADEGRRRRLPGFGGRSGESSGARGPERAGRPQPERRPGGQADGPESTEETVEIQALDGGRTRSIDLSALHAREAGQTSSPSDGETTQAQSRHALPGVTPRDPAPAAGRDEAATQPALRLPQHDRPVRLPGAGAPVAGQEAGQAEPGAGRGAGRAEPGAGQGAGRAEPGAGQDEPADGVRQEGEEADGSEDDEPRRSGWLVFLREVGLVISIALVISFLVKTFLAQPFWIPSGSMNQTLIEGDRVVVSKLTPGPFDLNRGDVVVFEDPGGWLQTQTPERGPVATALEFVGLYPAGDNHLIKRVIGMPGDRVVCCDRQQRLTVNGTPLTEPYVQPGDNPSDLRFDVRVPAGRVWVMGDHRSDSSDSRYHDDGTGRAGSVPIDKITGRAVVIVWPVGRMGWLSDYSSTFDKVNDP